MALDIVDGEESTVSVCVCGGLVLMLSCMMQPINASKIMQPVE